MRNYQKDIKGLLGEARSFARSLVAPPPPRDPHQKGEFVLFGRPRSGSTLLVDLIDRHPDARCLGELLNPLRTFPVAYVHRELARLREPRRGFKLLSYQTRNEMSAGNAEALRQWMRQPGVTVFHLRRENLVRHAISHFYAHERKVFHSVQTGADKARRITIDPDLFVNRMEKANDMFDWEMQYLDGIDIEPVSYEADLATPEAQGRTLTRVLSKLDLPPIEARSDLRPVTPREPGTLVENWDAIARRLEGTEFERFIEA